MASRTALSRRTSSQCLQTRALAWDFSHYSDTAPSTLRNHALALALFKMYLGILLSLETPSRFMQDSRFSKPPARTGRLGPPARPARYGLPARS
eukprot:29009-Pyramimonas_sp.AAC.1